MENENIAEEENILDEAEGEHQNSPEVSDQETEYTYENTIMMSKIEEYQSQNITRISKIMETVSTHMRESREYVEQNMNLMEEKLEQKIENAMERMMALNAESFSMIYAKLNENNEAKGKKNIDSDSDRDTRSARKTPLTRRTPSSRKLGRDMDAELITMSMGRSKSRKKDQSITDMVLNHEGNTERKVLAFESTEHLKIRWRKPTLNSFLNFMESIAEFQKQYNQKVHNIYTHIDDAVRDVLKLEMSRLYPNQFETDMDFYEATGEQIKEAVQIMFCPLDTLAFLNALRESCKGYAVEQVGKDYTQTRKDLYKLKTKFTQRYLFLENACKMLGEKEADRRIPRLTLKEHGSLKIWMQLIPEIQREKVRKLLASDNFGSLRGFMDAFFEVVEETYVMKECAVNYSSRVGVDLFGSNDAGKHISSKDTPRRNVNITEEIEAAVASSGEITQSEEDEPKEIHAIAGDPREKLTQRKHICLRFEQSGSCDKGSRCNFSHDQAEITAWRVGTYRRLKNALEREGRLPADNPRIYTRNAAPGQEGARKNFNVMEAPEREFNCIVGELMKITDTTDLWNVAHRKAMLHSKDGRHIPINAALFDSGADTDNYISSKVIMKHGLEKEVAFCKKGVRVANGAVVTISGEISLRVTVLDKDGNPTEADLLFLILDGLTKELDGMIFVDIFRKFWLTWSKKEGSD